MIMYRAYPIKKRIPVVGAACSRDSRLQGVYALQGAPANKAFSKAC
jgi:hypothetical protein